MRITRGQVIAGQHAVALRDALRPLKGRPFSAQDAARRVGTPQAGAAALVEALAKADLVVEAEPVPGGPWYQLTLAGNALANATARRPVSRAVARRHLEGLIERAGRANASPDYLVWVDRIVCFGSYLDETVERLGDVDVAVELTPRTSGAEFTELTRARVEQAVREGRRFSNFFGQLSWPETEVKLFLKARSPVLALTSTRDRVLEHAASCVVYVRKRHDHTP